MSNVVSVVSVVCVVAGMTRGGRKPKASALPWNPGRDLKAKGRPPGATGVAQCVELFEQLRGEANSQVRGTRVALAHNAGGPTPVAEVTMLEGPGGHGR